MQLEALLQKCDRFCKLAQKLPEVSRTSQLSYLDSGMRPESMEMVRKQRHHNEKMRPIVVTVFPDGMIGLNDGRHRLSVAKERGDTSIAAHILYYDDDLNIIHEENRDLIID